MFEEKKTSSDDVSLDDSQIDEVLDKLSDLLFDTWVIKCNEEYNENND